MAPVLYSTQNCTVIASLDMLPFVASSIWLVQVKNEESAYI